jgi:hypothetical protein
VIVFTLRLEDELAERVDGARGDVPRQRWLVRAVEQALEDGDASPRGVVSRASAEPRAPVVGRTLTGRPVGPVPKGQS